MSQDTFPLETKRLDSVLLTATNLCQQLQLLQKMQGQENSLLTQYGEILTAQAKEIEATLLLFKENMQTSIKNATNEYFAQLPDKLNSTIDQTLDEKFIPILDKQNEIVDESKLFLAKLQKDRYGAYLWKFLGVSLIIGLLVGTFVGVLITKELLPKNLISLTSSQINSLALGENIQKNWPKLSSQEKEHIKKLI